MQGLLPKSKLALRFWTLQDAEFVCKVRNVPELQMWFKQDTDLTLDEQCEFMRRIAPEISYYGFIIDVNDIPIGICSLKLDKFKRAEFGIAILPRFQGKGYAREAMDQLCSVAFNEFQCKEIYSDVFVHNPALPFYLTKCGFKAYKVKERAYYKRNVGYVDTVLIRQVN